MAKKMILSIVVENFWKINKMKNSCAQFNVSRNHWILLFISWVVQSISGKKQSSIHTALVLMNLTTHILSFLFYSVTHSGISLKDLLTCVDHWYAAVYTCVEFWCSFTLFVFLCRPWYWAVYTVTLVLSLFFIC